jgi:hypothetical protein
MCQVFSDESIAELVIGPIDIIRRCDNHKEILDNLDSYAKTQKNTLINKIATSRMMNADPEDVSLAESIYNKHKVEGMELISMDISLPSMQGIINYRLNGQHKQIRF